MRQVEPFTVQTAMSICLMDAFLKERSPLRMHRLFVDECKYTLVADLKLPQSALRIGGISNFHATRG